ncbi:transposable element Tcb2 transposase [Trichonephila clavipes]|nr:transposable element Tcb2 transposase [Trichonephila clavipes]
MSQRRRLPNSLRWRAVGWMEMGLSQADAARRLNVSRSVVQRLWDQYQSEDYVSRRPVPGRPRATTPAEDRAFSSSFGTKEKNHYCAAARCRPFSSIRKKNLRYYGAKSFTMQVCMQEDQLCAFPSTDDSEGTAYAGQENMASTDLEEQRTRYHQSNTVERHSYRGGGILAWAGISLGGHTDLHVFHGGTVTGLRYRDEILDPYVRPYAAAIGNDFILMDDNARPHRARIVEEYLEDHGLERMEWPARSPDLNPIEHLWDYLGREVAALNPPPRSLHELKQGLLCVWSSLPIPVSAAYQCRSAACLAFSSRGLSSTLLASPARDTNYAAERILAGRVCGGRVACVVGDGSKERSAESGPRGRGTWFRMARRRGLLHIEKSSIASALDRARQHVMTVSRSLALKNPPAVTLGTLETCGNSWPGRGRDGTGRNP